MEQIDPCKFEKLAELLDEEPLLKARFIGLAEELKDKYFVVIDDFLERDLASKLASEVKRSWRDGLLQPSKLAGGRSGQNQTYSLEQIRGDKVGWFMGDPCHDKSTGRQEADVPPDGRGGACWNGEALQVLMRRLGTLVQSIAVFVPELQGIERRSEAMVTCYPGNGSHYVRHCDNPSQNGRKLTALYYLNQKWSKSDGGELRIFACECDDIVADINPVLDRLVLFFSDNRVPHEVLPTHKERFAITHWFYDYEERAMAESMVGKDSTSAAVSIDWLIEQQRIQDQIARFESEQGWTAKVFEGTDISHCGTHCATVYRDDHLRQMLGSSHQLEPSILQLDTLD